VALTAVVGLAAPQSQAPAHASGAANGARVPAGYTPIQTGQGMCLDAGPGRDG
jgi:hypothetical protein